MANDRRENLLDALAELDLADEEEAEYLPAWLEIQPGHEDPEDQDPASLVMQVSKSLHRVTWFAAGPPELFVPVVGGFLADAGAAEQELRSLQEAGQHMEADALGSWISLSKETLDGGWYLPMNTSLAKARNFAPTNPVNAALGEWARKCGADTCAQLRRSVDDEAPSTELTIVVPGSDPAHELALVQQAFKSVGAPWFTGAVASALKSAESLELLLIVGIGQAGLNHVGVLMPDPDAGLLDAYSGVEGTDAEGIRYVEDALGVDGPGMIGAFQYPTGFGVERFYAL